jgi:hypothetical protein
MPSPRAFAAPLPVSLTVPNQPAKADSAVGPCWRWSSWGRPCVGDELFEADTSAYSASSRGPQQRPPVRRSDRSALEPTNDGAGPAHAVSRLPGQAARVTGKQHRKASVIFAVIPAERRLGTIPEPVPGPGNRARTWLPAVCCVKCALAAAYGSVPTKSPASLPLGLRRAIP